MRADKRLYGCPNLFNLRDMENFTVLTGRELKLLQEKKGRKLQLEAAV